MSNDTIRVGIVGAGAVTRAKHIPGLQAIDGVEVVGIANRSRESAQRVADQFNIPNVYDSWVDLIAAPDSDAICIGTWPYMHRTMVFAALESDKHVLTEARMAMDARESREMLDASHEKPNLVAQVVPGTFIDEAETVMRDLMADGYLGDLLSVDLSVVRSGAPHRGFIDRNGSYHWRYDRDLSGLNIMLLGAWYEGVMRLIGPATSVTAITRVYNKSRIDDAGNRHVISIPDHVEILCEMAAGPVMHIRFTEVTGLAPLEQMWFFGSDGTLFFDADAERLFGGRRDDEALQEIEVPPEKKGGWRVEEEFINAIRGLEPITHTTFEDGVRYMEFTEAVTRSAQARETVFLPL